MVVDAAIKINKWEWSFIRDMSREMFCLHSE